MKKETINTDNFVSGEIKRKPVTGFTKEHLKKQFRFSEVFAEKIISLVAMMSITVIILIFLFVFRESFPLFKSRPIQKSEVTTNSISEGLKPETYGSAPEESAELKPETYGEVIDSGGTKEADFNASGQEKKVMENLKAPWQTFNEPVWYPVSDNPRFGLWPLITGTLKVTLIAILFAAPLAVLAALYTSAFASRRKREIIKPVIELLAGFPSVVIGFFALMVMAGFFQDIFGYSSRLNGFVGGAAMALAAIPIIYTIAEDALSAVPKTYKEASLALGANLWQTAFFVILPAAVPGIFAAVLLGIGRIFGETMIVLMATGNAALMSANPFESVRTFAATIGAEMAETVFGDDHYSVLFFIGSLLFVLTFLLNAIAEFYVKGKLVKRIQGK